MNNMWWIESGELLSAQLDHLQESNSAALKAREVLASPLSTNSNSALHHHHFGPVTSMQFNPLVKQIRFFHL
jgi:hypothetical protein